MQDETTPPRSLSAFRSTSPDSDLDSQDGHSQDSFAGEASVVEAPSVGTFDLEPLKKQLVLDIIERGGLHSLDAQGLIDDKPSYYDNCPAVPRRKSKTKNLISYWKREPKAYRTVLKNYGLEDIALGTGLQSPPKSVTKKAKSVPRKTPTKRSTPRRQTSSRSLPTEEEQHLSPPPKVIRQKLPSNNMATNPFTDELRLKAAAMNNIRVANTECPEQNGGSVTISTATEIPHAGRLRVAYCLSINGDIRYAMDKSRAWYRAYVHGPSEVLVHFPSQPYPDLYDPKSYERGRDVAKETNKPDTPRYVQSEKLVRNGLLGATERLTTVYCFKFNEILDNTILSPNAVNNRIQVRVIPEINEAGTSTGRAKIFFPVVVHDDDPPRIDAPTADADDNELSGLLGKMSPFTTNGN